MHEWEEVQALLSAQNINNQNEELLKQFLLSLGFDERQQIMGILLGFPEKCAFFIELLEKKKLLAENNDAELKEEVIKQEKDLMRDLLIDAQK